MASQEFDLILLGGGHAHCAVLADWIRRGPPVERAALITPHPYLRYSGMVPGWIAGDYDEDEGRVHLRGLAEQAGITFVEDRCIAIDPDARCVTTQNHGDFTFGYCSIDTGGMGRAADKLGDDPRLVDVRPIEGLAERVADENSIGPIAIIGGGAGGVELAFALRNDRSGVREVALITGQRGLLPDFARGPRELVRRALEAQNIAVVEADAVQSEGRLELSEHPTNARVDPLKSAQLIIAALGSGAPNWPRAGGLQCDERGFICVDQFQRSLSHLHIFAVGDVAARQDMIVPHSGVHSVHAGPVLADNLRTVVGGAELSRSYRPRPVSLYILSTANSSAIASYGPVAVEGEWVNDLKRWIDKRWIDTYAKHSGTV